MSCIYKIEASRPILSKTEEKIADYILEHRKDILDDTTQSLADKIPTSAAAIIRFSKKIGYSGFSALKLDLAQDTHIDDPQNLLDLIGEDDNLTSIIKKAKMSNQNMVENTYSMLSESVLDSAVSVLKQARHIHLVGVGGSGVVCRDFKMKLLRLGYLVSFEEDVHVRVSSLNSLNKEDVIVAFSYSGETQDVVKTAQVAKSKGASVIAITQVGKTALQKYSDIVLHVPIEEQEIRFGAITSRSSSLIISDILYLCLAQADLMNTKEKLVQSRTMLKQII